MIWWLPHAILIVFNLLNAWHDSVRIKKHKKIYHGVNLLAYTGAAIGAGAILGYTVWGYVVLVAAAFFGRLTVFNPSLSVLRGLKWDYVSPERKAVADKILYRIFGHNGKAPVYISGLLWVIILIIDYFV